MSATYTNIHAKWKNLDKIYQRDLKVGVRDRERSRMDNCVANTYNIYKASAI